jgi:hypothetical protein
MQLIRPVVLIKHALSVDQDKIVGGLPFKTLQQRFEGF